MREEFVSITTDDMHLEGLLEMPDKPMGIVLFAGGVDRDGDHVTSGNHALARYLRQAGIGSMLLEGVSGGAAKDYYTRFDITLLAQQLGRAADWLALYADPPNLPLGLFATGTGAAAALQLAAWRGSKSDGGVGGIAALVSRDGRVDMAGRQTLEKVRVPCLLIVGGQDQDVVGLNRMAFAALPCDKQLELISGAADTAGMLHAAALPAREWFTRHFAGRAIEWH